MKCSIQMLSKSKFMKFNTFMGVDVSKKTLDICLLQEQQTQYFKIENQRKNIEQFLSKHLSAATGTCIAMENTGRYNVALLAVLAETSFSTYVISPLHLSKKSGLVRGKNDKIDSLRIARFIQQEYSQLKPWQPQREVITELQLLLTERRRIVNVIKELKTASQELDMFELSFAIKSSRKVHKQMLLAAQKSLKALESAIDQLIATDEQLTQQMQFITSVKGVGKILGLFLIIRTNEFKTINDPRKLACYAGVAPFEHQSGTSIRGRTRVSFFADKELKKLLHLASMSVIRLKGEIRDYYLRKVAEGKNKMSVLNAVRNKLIHRVCAMVSQKRCYVPDLVLS